MPIVELPNGQEIEFPDGTSSEVMRSAILKKFPQYNRGNYSDNNHEKAASQGKSWNELMAMSQFPEQPKKRQLLPNGTPLAGKEVSPKELLRYGIKDPLIGLAQMGNTLIHKGFDPEAKSDLGKALRNFGNINGRVPSQRKGIAPPSNYNYAKALGLENENTLDKVFQAAPELAISLMAPEMKLPWLASKLPAASKIVGNVIPQGILSATLAKEKPLEQGATTAGVMTPFSTAAEAIKSSNPKIRNLGRALGATGAAVPGYLLANSLSGNPYMSGMTAALAALWGGRGNPMGRFAEEANEAVLKPEAQAALAAAKRRGIHLTPGEATQSPFVLAEESRLGGTKKGAQTLIDANKRNLGAQKAAIEDVTKSIYNPLKSDRPMKYLYKKSGEAMVPDEFVQRAMDNDILRKSVQNVTKDSAFSEKLKGASPESLEFWNLVKQNLDHRIEKASNTRGSILKSTRKDLIQDLDKASSKYERARGIAERRIARSNLEEKFNTKEKNGKNLSEILSDKTYLKSLRKSLRNAPAVQDKVDDLEVVFKRLREVKPEQLAKNASSNPIEKVIANPKDALSHARNFLSGKYDETMAELITNPKWESELNKMVQLSKNKKEKSAEIVNILGKVAAQVNSKKEGNK